MLKEASVPLDSSDAEQTRSTCSNKKQYFDLLEGDGELSPRDVSIRGLSDRACAELTYDFRSSLFGFILRLQNIKA